MFDLASLVLLPSIFVVLNKGIVCGLLKSLGPVKNDLVALPNQCILPSLHLEILVAFHHL